MVPTGHTVSMVTHAQQHTTANEVTFHCSLDTYHKGGDVTLLEGSRAYNGPNGLLTTDSVNMQYWLASKGYLHKYSLAHWNLNCSINSLAKGLLAYGFYRG